MSANNLTQTAWADHLRGCADIASDISARLGLRDDAAKQACFATVAIDATKHNVFVRPIPEQDAKPEPSATPKPDDQTFVIEDVGDRRPRASVTASVKDVVAAAKADAQIKDIDTVPTPEKADSAKRTALLEGVQGAVKVLNKEGFTPPLTPKSLNAFIKTELNADGGLGTLDTEHLEALIELLNKKIDTFKANKTALELEAPF